MGIMTGMVTNNTGPAPIGGNTTRRSVIGGGTTTETALTVEIPLCCFADS